MEEIRLKDDAVEQLRAHCGRNERPSDVIERFVPDASSADEDPEAAEQLAGEILDARDQLNLKESEQLSAAQYIRKEYDVDPSEFDSEEELRRAVRGNRHGGEQ